MGIGGYRAGWGIESAARDLKVETLECEEHAVRASSFGYIYGHI